MTSYQQDFYKMLIQYNDRFGSVFLDLDLARIRVFLYDENSEWEREHSQGKELRSGDIVDGKLTDKEVSELRLAGSELQGIAFKQMPLELHCYEMIKLSISDGDKITISEWNDGEGEENPHIKLGKLIRLMAPIKSKKYKNKRQ